MFLLSQDSNFLKFVLGLIKPYKLKHELEGKLGDAGLAKNLCKTLIADKDPHRKKETLKKALVVHNAYRGVKSVRQELRKGLKNSL